ncbi:GNAT family N-acetyltransferase [Streptomyces sp. NPDC058000]|uniref:GNAT family N-acetyltransferase n=1 Tax=Streptomyces sp. NPDC058000 TaxID=3346299 RepID=UPI0036E29B0F
MTPDGKTAIRRADAADAAAVARIHLASRAATMPYLPPQKRSHDQVTQWIRDLVLTQYRTWVAVRGTEIVGYAAAESGMLHDLYLRPDVLRQGIGTLLLDEVKRDSPGEVSLYVFQQNTGARAFYERHGFTVVDTNDGSRNMEALPDMTLRWRADGAR